MLIVLAVWLILLVLALTTGSLGHWLLRCGDRELPLDLASLPSRLWLGICLQMALLIIWSCFFPVSRAATAALVALALAGVPATVGWLARACRRRRQSMDVTRIVALTTMMIALGCYLAYRSAKGVDWWDTVSTHVQQLKWIREYGAVPGLGNLNPKLGFDSSIYVYAAAMEPLRALHGKSVHFAVGFLVLVTVLDWLLTGTATTNRRVRCFCALTLPFLILHAQRGELASLSSDFAMSVFMLAAVQRLLAFDFAATEADDPMMRAQLPLLLALAAASAAAKLSGVMVLFGAMFALAVWSLRHVARAQRVRVIVTASVLPTLMLVGIVARRIILTGWPLYPSPALRLPLSWSVPRAVGYEEYQWIKSWARAPRIDYHVVLAEPFLEWFVPWYNRFRSTDEYSLLLLALAAIFVIAVSHTLRSRVDLSMRIPLAVTVASIVYWFVMAPDVRFGGVFIWMLLAIVAPVLFDTIESSFNHRLATVAACIVALWITGAFNVLIENSPQWRQLPGVPVMDTRPIAIDNGQTPPLIINVPTSQARCGDAELPCSHYVEKQRWRVPGRLGSGFLSTGSQ